MLQQLVVRGHMTRHGGMSTTVISTDIVSVNNKVQWFVNLVKSAINDGTKFDHMQTDSLAIAELLIMIDLSKGCNYVAGRNINRHGFERTPSNWLEIPTTCTVVEMNTNFCGNSDTICNLRWNEVTSAVISDVICLIETRMMYQNQPETSINILSTYYISGTHMGIIKAVCDIMTDILFTDGAVVMHMCLHRNLLAILNNVLLQNRYVVGHGDIHWTGDLANINQSNKGGSVVVMMNHDAGMTEIKRLMKTKDVLMSMLVPMGDPLLLNEMIDLIKKSNLIMEMAEASDPNKTYVRVKNSIWDNNSSINKTIFRQKTENNIGMVSSITYRIRPMNLNRMCYDCRMIFKIANIMMSTARARSGLTAATRPSTGPRASLSPSPSTQPTTRPPPSICSSTCR